MAGLTADTPYPLDMKFHQQSAQLEIHFSNGAQFTLPYEFLRVFSPSAEVRGHGPGQDVLQTGKREVGVRAVEPVGHYAVRILFTDGHDSGIYSWDHLFELGQHQARLWAQYLAKLEAAGASRDVETPRAPVSGCKG
jgi:DUF971 family protein